MVQLCTTSKTVKTHSLYSWDYNFKLWEAKNRVIKASGGKRSIATFPKFSYVIEKIFSLSGKECMFFYSETFHNLDGDGHYSIFSPYKSLSSFVEYTGCIPKDRERFPAGLDTPKWWTAYNKIKHDMDEAENRVTYQVAIEAMAALFILLSTADAEIETLEANGFIKNGAIKSRLFACKIP